MKNLHDEEAIMDLGIEGCLQEAMHTSILTAPPADENELTVGNFRLPKGLKAEVHRICESKGTSLSTFLRACCERLVATRQAGMEPSELPPLPPAAILEQLKPQE